MGEQPLAQRRFSAYLHDSRVKAGLSQKEVAQSLGYHTAQVVSDWERGVRSPPANVFRKLVKLYGVPIEKFFELLLEERKAILEQKLRKQVLGQS